MAKPQLSLKRRPLRLFLWIGAIAVVYVIYGALLGAQTNSYLGARYTAHLEPEVNVVPQPLIDNTISEAPGTTLAYYGNAFETPWSGAAQLRSVGKLSEIKFASGQVLLVSAPAGKQGFLQEVADDKTTGTPELRALFAADIKDGPYQEESALLNATSDQVKFFDPAWVSARRFFLLFFKSIAENSEIKTGIYAFHSSVVRGFQIGNPSYSPHVRLDFFDWNGNSVGEIISAYGKETSYRGIQADLNRIIQTFHPLAPSAPAPASAANDLHPTAR